MNLNIFNLKEGSTYYAVHKGRVLERRFRVKNGELENDGIGRFAPCDWTPVDASLKFQETSTRKTGLIVGLVNIISNVLTRPFKSKKGLSLVQLKEGVVYTSDNNSLPGSLVIENGRLLSFETKEEVVLKKLSLRTRFKVLSAPTALVPRKTEAKEVINSNIKETVKA